MPDTSIKNPIACTFTSAGLYHFIEPSYNTIKTRHSPNLYSNTLTVASSAQFESRSNVRMQRLDGVEIYVVAR